MKIYLAGPLFSAAERDFNTHLARLLRELGHEVFLPQESEQESMTPREIFARDVAGIDWAEAVVANMDGPDPDSGTCWECGYAHGRKPVMVFRTDFRAAYELGPDMRLGTEREHAPYNLMLTESATARLDMPFARVEMVAGRIDAALRGLQLDSRSGDRSDPPRY